MATITKTIEIPAIPRRGEIWFSVNLGLIEDVPALYSLLQRLGFKPQLAYMQTRHGMEIHLLLHHEQRLELMEPAELFEEEQQVLADAIEPNAMRFACGLTRAA